MDTHSTQSDDQQSDPLHAVPDSESELSGTAANDAVAGETVLDQPGDGDGGPTGGSPREGAPYAEDSDLAGQDVDLDETPPA